LVSPNSIQPPAKEQTLDPVINKRPAVVAACQVHFRQNALSHANKGQRQMVLALINTVFAQDNQEAATTTQWRPIADQVRTKLAQFLKLCTLMD
jgi:transposase-like protein